MQVDKNLSFDQFSHDLTLALEETSRGTGSRWGLRRRTRSTGNLRKDQFEVSLPLNFSQGFKTLLAFPPQPTEEDSSSTDPNAATNDSNNNDFTTGAVGNSNSILSDSDDRQSYAYAFKLRQTSYLVKVTSFLGGFEIILIFDVLCFRAETSNRIH